MATEIEIVRKYTITDEDIDDIMCSALEGGINYWCCEVEVVGDYLGEYASEQISRGGELMLHDIEDYNETWTLDKNKLINGIKMAIANNDFADYEWYANGMIDTCQIDADVADVIVQYALFNEIVFG